MKKHIAILVSLSLAIQPLYPAAEAPPEALKALAKKEARALSKKLLAKNQECLNTGKGCKPAKRDALVIMRDFEAGNTSAVKKGLKAYLNTHNACLKFVATILGFPLIFAEGAITGMTKAFFTGKDSFIKKTLASRTKWMADALKLKGFLGGVGGGREVDIFGKFVSVPLLCGTIIGIDIILVILLIMAALGIWTATTPSGKRWEGKRFIQSAVENNIMQVPQITTFINESEKFKSLLNSSSNINEVILYMGKLKDSLNKFVSKDNLNTIIKEELAKIRPAEQDELGISFTQPEIEQIRKPISWKIRGTLYDKLLIIAKTLQQNNALFPYGHYSKNLFTILKAIDENIKEKPYQNPALQKAITTVENRAIALKLKPPLDQDQKKVLNEIGGNAYKQELNEIERMERIKAWK